MPVPDFIPDEFVGVAWLLSLSLTDSGGLGFPDVGVAAWGVVCAEEVGDSS